LFSLYHSPASQTQGFNKKIKPYIPDFKLAFDKVCTDGDGTDVIVKMRTHCEEV
jgi:hypothetical protein